MVKVSVFYPGGDGKHFDMKYYCEKHIPMVQKLCGAPLRGVAVEGGVSGMMPGSPAPYLAMGHLLFESVAAFQAIQPVIQISEVKL